MKRTTTMLSLALSTALAPLPARAAQDVPEPVRPRMLPAAFLGAPEAPRPVLAAAGASLASLGPPLAAADMALASVGPSLVAAEVALASVRPALAGAGTGFLPNTAGRWATGTFRETAPAPWLGQDPADSIYRAARDQLNRREYEQAARTFRTLRERFPRSGYVGDAFYFEALASYRVGGQARQERALELLVEQERRHPDAATRGDARALRLRIQGALASAGDAESAAAVERRAADPSQEGCDEGEQELRATALGALLQMDADRAMPILREVLEARDACSAPLRRHAVFLVAQKLDDAAVDILLDLAHRDPDPDREVRENAVFWLSRVESPEALPALESILRSGDADPELRERAVFAIARHGGDRGVAILREFAERTDAPRDLRAQAIFWLGRSTGADGATYLRNLYPRLDDGELKERILHAVSRTGDDESRRWLLARARDRSESVDVRKQALFWAGQMGMETGELRGLYDSLQDREMKEQVIFVLSRQDGADAVDELMTIARNEDDAELRQRAVFWLGRSDDPRVPAFLLELVRGGAR